MLFNTTQFFLFLAVVLVLFYLSPRRLRKYILLAASYFFYASWNAKFIALLLTLTVIDYTAGPLAGARAAGPAAQSRADLQPGREPRLPRLLQVLQFPRRQPRAAPGTPGQFVLPPDRPAARHQLPHLPEHVLRDRCLPRRAAGRAQSGRLRALHLLLPATGGRPHRPRARFLPRSLGLEARPPPTMWRAASS